VVMASERFSIMQRFLQTLADRETRLSDQELLCRYAAQQDNATFEALVWRYGHMVWRICWAQMGDEHAAEDVFQATFLVLARRAGQIRKHEALGPFLHRVACRLAEKARNSTKRRLAREQRFPSPGWTNDEDSELSVREARLVLDA